MKQEAQVGWKNLGLAGSFEDGKEEDGFFGLLNTVAGYTRADWPSGTCLIK